MIGNPRFTAVVLGLLVIFSVAGAADLRVGGSNHAEYWVFVDTALANQDQNFKEHFEDKFKLNADYGDLTLRSVLFYWEPSLPNSAKLNYLDYTALYRKDPVNLLYGRYYVTLGRGLCLNQFLDEDFRNDNSLFGFKADIKYFKSRLTLLSGTPRNLFFEQNTYAIKNDVDTAQIRGADFETQWLQPVTIGGRYVRINRTVDLTPESFTELYGGNIGLRAGPYEGYFEYGRQWGCYPYIGGRLSGNGFLFTNGLSLPGFGLTFQLVDYDSLGFPGEKTYRYNEPPTPIKSGISVNRGLDEVGYGVGVMYAPLDFVTLQLDHNKVTSRDTSESRVMQYFTINDDLTGVLETVAKVKANPTLAWEVMAGVERIVKQRIELPIDKKTELKPSLEVTYNLGELFLEGGFERNMITAQSFTLDETFEYVDQEFSISIGKPERFVLFVRYAYRDHAPTEDWLIEKLGTQTSWPMAELSLDITNRHNLRIRVGAEKGGLVCSGGVCRFEEPFRGIKAVLTSVF